MISARAGCLQLLWCCTLGAVGRAARHTAMFEVVDDQRHEPFCGILKRAVKNFGKLFFHHHQA
ncbi:hypothetical protein D3C80_438860 [compost metagenome]